MKLQVGDIVQQFDGHGRAIYEDGNPLIRTIVSYETYKNNLDKFGSRKYVTLDTCNDNPKRYRKVEIGYRPYRISDELNEKEYRIVQETVKEMEYNPNFLDQLAGVENSEQKYLSERERKIVLSVLQSMGSHVGECFLKKAEPKETV